MKLREVQTKLDYCKKLCSRTEINGKENKKYNGKGAWSAAIRQVNNPGLCGKI